MKLDHLSPTQESIHSANWRVWNPSAEAPSNPKIRSHREDYNRARKLVDPTADSSCWDSYSLAVAARPMVYYLRRWQRRLLR